MVHLRPETTGRRQETTLTGRSVLYRFEAEGFGRCHLTNRTTGKHGFGLPKLFVIESADQPALGQFTYRYADNVVGDVHTAGF